jgi:hypothetical protein
MATMMQTNPLQMGPSNFYGLFADSAQNEGKQDKYDLSVSYISETQNWRGVVYNKFCPANLMQTSLLDFNTC